MALGVGAALLFSALAGVRLGAQGPQYDELHQATAAFSHLGGASPELFSLAEVARYPILNMTYSAAIKTHLYGLYLRLRGEFRLEEWRALGIGMVAAGILALALLAASALPPAPLALLLALVVGDATLLLLGRHDWGPVALAFLLRASLLGLWLRSETSAPPGDARYAAGLGLVTGLAVFEKLSSVVLLAPLTLFVAFGPSRRRGVRAGAVAAGLALGALPLVAVNVASQLRTGRLVSLQGASAPEEGSLDAAFRIAEGYLGLGAGTEAATLVLGLPPLPALARWEIVLSALCLGLAAVLGVAKASAPQGRRALVAVAGYLGVLLGLLALPRGTWIHHWILGSPLQLLGVSLALSAERAGRRGRATRALSAALWLGCGAWLAERGIAVGRVERGLAAGRASAHFDPHLIDLGELAARRASEARFVATDWGVATQIYFFSSGRARVVEPFWDDASAGRLRETHLASGKPLLYLVRLEPAPGVGAPRTARIERTVATSGEWIELPLEPQARSWPRLWLRKYAWAPRRAETATSPTGLHDRRPPTRAAPPPLPD